ncbi:MAG: four helix bundle protein [Armatimonadetes bacterium]|nr:four helix bundle protein [Armatimonadota bacterium]
MESYKELAVWQKAIELVTDIYEVTKSFPQEERYGLIAQIQRAAISVPANIAEGWGRGSTKEYLQYLRVSRGSLAELETHLIISYKLDFISTGALHKLQKDIDTIGRMTNNLIKSLQRKLSPNS